MQPNQADIGRWSAAAPYWEKYRDIILRMFAPVTQALAEASQVGSGQTVLDVATGPGEPALSLAALVGPQGKVVGVDPAPEMVAAARRAAERAGLRNAQFDVAFAGQLPFAPDTFDAVVSRFGVMFFPSPLDAVRDMLRVLKPNCKLALAAWHSVETNPFFGAISRVVARFVDSPPPEPDAPDAFRFAAPGKLRDVLEEAGASAPSERLLRFTIDVPLTVEEVWTLRTEMSDTLREKLARLSSEQLLELKRQSLEALSPYVTGGGMSMPSEVLIVSGAKPA